MSSRSHWLSRARSILFVPASRPERIQKARESGADGVCIDLEDAVAADVKDEARRNLSQWLDSAPTDGAPISVRINAPDSNDGQTDVALLRTMKPITVMIPKVTSVSHIDPVAAALPGAAFIALIENRAGIKAADAIARGRAVAALAFGALDYASSLNAQYDHPWLNVARVELRGAAADRGITCFDAPWPEVNDDETLQQRAVQSARFGYSGMLAIHPRQVPVINAAFSPSSEEIERAQRICAAAATSTGVVVLDGSMIDAPVVKNAQQLLARAQALGLAGT